MPTSDSPRSHLGRSLDKMSIPATYLSAEGQNREVSASVGKRRSARVTLGVVRTMDGLGNQQRAVSYNVFRRQPERMPTQSSVVIEWESKHA